MSQDYHTALLESLAPDHDDGCYVGDKKYILRSAGKQETPPTATAAPGAGGEGEGEGGEALEGAGAYYASTGGEAYAGYEMYGRPEPAVHTTADRTEADEICRSLEQLVGDGPNKGSDLQLVATVPTTLDAMAETLTPSEIAYCEHAPDKGASTAGRLAAKRAIAQALSVDASDSLFRDMEIVASSTQAPAVMLSGAAQQAAEALGVSDVKLTISHSGAYAIAAACAT